MRSARVVGVVGSQCYGRPAKVRSQITGQGIRKKVSGPCQATPEQQENGSSSLMEKMINGLTVAIQSSPLAQGKVRLAIAQAGEYDEEAVKARMERYISENKVMVFSFSTCPFCKNAKKVLDDMGVEYEAVELNDVEGGMALRAELAKRTGRTSMPNIWIGGKGIGGCNDGPGLMTLYKSGELDGMLKEVGALSR